jgi:hypothetical protein
MKPLLTFLILFVFTFVLSVMFYMPGQCTDNDLMATANTALVELSMSEYKPIKVNGDHLFQSTLDLNIIAINQKTGKKVVIEIFKPKSILWEKHDWRLNSIKELL